MSNSVFQFQYSLVASATKMDRHLAFVFAFTVLCAVWNLSEASDCVPNSKFKVDCNTCQCSPSGKEYMCSNEKCPPNDLSNKYDTIETKDGYKVLVPKGNDDFEFKDDDFTLTRKPRRPVSFPPGYPYVNDELEELNNDISSEDHDVEGDHGKFVDVDGSLDTVENIDEEYNNNNRLEDDESEESNDVDRSRFERYVQRGGPVPRRGQYTPLGRYVNRKYPVFPV